MHAVFRYAVQNDFIDKDYSKFVIIDNTTQKKDKSIFTDTEITALWQHTDNFYVKLALILIYTGFRITELLTLPVTSIYLDKGYIRHGLKTKNGKDRIVPIHPRIIPFIVEFMQNNTDHLITDPLSHKKLTAGHIRSPFKQTLCELSMEHGFHECRHTTASLLNRYGAKELSIKKILSHSSQDLTKDVYTHVTVDELITAINLIP